MLVDEEGKVRGEIWCIRTWLPPALELEQAPAGLTAGEQTEVLQMLFIKRPQHFGLFFSWRTSWSPYKNLSFLFGCWFWGFFCEEKLA